MSIRNLQGILESLLARSDYIFSERVEIRDLFSAFWKDLEKKEQEDQMKIEKIDECLANIEKFYGFRNEAYNIVMKLKGEVEK